MTLRKNPNHKECINCHKFKNPETQFYASSSPNFPDGRSNMCKKCLNERLNENDPKSVRSVLRLIDKPYIPDEWQKCIKSEKATLGWYLRQISSLSQYSELTYDDSTFYTNNEGQNIDPRVNDNGEFDRRFDVESSVSIPEISIEVKLKFGSGFTDFEYMQMEKEYQDMIIYNNIETPQHKKQLVLYCKNNCFMERASNENRLSDYEKLSKIQKDLITMAGFQGKDKRDGSEQSGIRNFSILYEEVEKMGFIEPYPIDERQDIIDLSLQYLVNYTLKLLDREQLGSPPSDTPRGGIDK